MERGFAISHTQTALYNETQRLMPKPWKALAVLTAADLFDRGRYQQVQFSIGEILDGLGQVLG